MVKHDTFRTLGSLLLAALILSWGVLNSNGAVWEPQSMQTTDQHQPVSSSSTPGPPQ